jgi:hypothetical protein
VECHPREGGDLLSFLLQILNSIKNGFGHFQDLKRYKRMALRHLLFSSSFGLEKLRPRFGVFFLGTNCSEKIPLFDVLFYNGECFINASLQGISGVFIYFSDETLL